MLPVQSIISALAQQGYAVVDNALPTELAQALAKVAHDYHDDFSPAGIGPQNNRVLEKTIRQDEISWIQGDTPVTADLLAQMQNLQDGLNQQAFLGLRRFESHYAHYPPGGFYKKHVDAFRHKRGRLVTIVYYLNDSWQPDHGGQLRMFDQDDQHLLDVAPVFNRLLVFMSEEFPHEVLPTAVDRYSIAGWFRTDELMPIAIS